MDHIYIHVDLDAFFASVEQLDHPEWRGRPVIVGGKPGDRRSVVSTASYEARRYGVHSAMPTAQAIRLCPSGIFVHGRMKRYHEKSAEVMAVFSEFSPDVQQISVDEAFIDLTGTERLFGDPEQTAMRLKKTVRERTGLTVSIGMGATKYIAKIASGLQKPDGFVSVPPGSETTFMLSLPLQKVWGVGTKTLEKLNAAGFFTTKDIYERTEPLLISIFGKATGSFLYNAVRGNEVETFSNEVKSHQLSAEKTFPFDLVGQDCIDTALLELSHTVLFRMLHEKVRSKTVSLKIRYEDFSTINVQETSTHDVSSIDDLFLRTKRLFARKYTYGRGIRLLGLSLQNTESASIPSQNDLFDFGEEKKNKVEKAILAVQKKDPSIKIQKARLLESNKLIPAIVCIISLFCGISGHLQAEETTLEASGAGSIVFDTTNLPPPDADGSIALFDYPLGDKNVEFRAEGYWQSTVTNTSSYSFGFGSTPGYSLGTPVFVQNVDLSLWFLLDNRWYFEASFADGFDKNTVAAGYYGEGILKSARIANRGIIFPSTYSIDTVNRGIGGGDNQAPGVSFHFADTTWTADAVLRYDMLESEEKTWYGKNSVSTDAITLSDYNTGQQYIVPSVSDATAINGVYVENSSGSYTDSQGRTYKKLDTSEYLVLPARCELILSSDAGAKKTSGVLPAVAVSFDDSVSVSATGLSLGTFGTASDPGTGFLGAIQEWFGSESDDANPVTIPNIGSYSYGKYGGSSGPGPDKTGTETDGFFTVINGSTTLLVQHPAGFSPFAANYRYACGSTAATDASVSSSETDTVSSVYLATITDDDTTFVSDDFFSSEQTYVDVYHSDITTTSTSAALNPAVRYPLADTDPGVYLGTTRTNDLVLNLRTYTAVSRFDIGTDAVAGTVRVYKNGIIDSGATYDSESGTITLSSTVSSSDRIYATWYEDSGSSDSGAVAAAAGIAWTPSTNVATDISFSTRWTYSGSRDYADATYSAPGFLTVAGGIKKQTENATLTNTAAATLESDNTTGYYRILGMSDSYTGTVYLTASAGVDLPDDFIPVLNDRPDSTDTMPTLESTLNGSVAAEDGTTDSGISGYAVPVSWNFESISSASSTEPAWASTAINLPGTASVLASASSFSIALKNKDPSDTALSVYLQLGVDADDDFTVEDTTTIPTWLVSKASDDDTNPTDVNSSFIPGTSGWQTVTIVLTDEDRARLSANYDARLIICSSDPSSVESGTLSVGPYEADDLVFSTSSNSAVTISGEQQTDSTLSSSDIKRFNSSTNYVQHFDWTTDTDQLSDLSSTDNFDLTLTRYFEEVDITPYSTISIWFLYDPEDESDYTGSADINSEILTLILDRPQSDGSYKETLHLKLTDDALSPYIGSSWHHLTINRTSGTVSIDGTKITQGKTLYTNADVVPVRLQLIVNSGNPDSNTIYETGNFSIDELSLSGANPHFILQDTASAAWKKEGPVLQTAKKIILSDVSFNTTGTGSSTIQTTGTAEPEGALSGNISGAATIAGIQVSADASRTTDSSSFISSAGHELKTAKPLFGLLSLTELYRFSSTEETLEKENDAAISLARIHIPLTLNATATSESTVWALTQKVTAKAAGSSGPVFYSVSAGASQKLLPSSSDVTMPDTDDYVQGLKDSTALAFSTGKSAASRRTITTEGNTSFILPFLLLKPSASFTTSGIYKSSTSTLFSDDTTTTLSLPVTIGKNNFTLSWEKAGGGVSDSTEGGSYFRDTSNLADSLNDKNWFFTAAPFIDLLSSHLSKSILADTTMTTTSSESLYYTGTYTTSWKRSFAGNRKDLLLPSTASFVIARDIRTSASVSDIYQIKGQVGYTALNIFGKTGSLPLFSWFRQDEYTTSFTATLKIPRTAPSDNTMYYTGYIQANFYVNDTDVLKTGLQGTYETTDDWSSKITVSWKRRGKYSPILGAVQLFFPRYSSKTISITRTDSLMVSLSEATSSSTTSSTVTKKQNVKLSHLLEFALTKFTTINGSVAGSYYSVWDSVVTISASASIGCTIKF